MFLGSIDHEKLPEEVVSIRFLDEGVGILGVVHQL